MRSRLQFPVKSSHSRKVKSVKHTPSTRFTRFAGLTTPVPDLNHPVLSWQTFQNLRVGIFRPTFRPPAARTSPGTAPSQRPAPKKSSRPLRASCGSEVPRPPRPPAAQTSPGPPLFRRPAPTRSSRPLRASGGPDVPRTAPPRPPAALMSPRPSKPPAALTSPGPPDSEPPEAQTSPGQSPSRTSAARTFPNPARPRRHDPPPERSGLSGEVAEDQAGSARPFASKLPLNNAFPNGIPRPATRCSQPHRRPKVLARHPENWGAISPEPSSPNPLPYRRPHRLMCSQGELRWPP